MSDVFVSHVEEDADIALEIALGLEEAGYTTWCYELDSIPGPSYLIQTGQAVEVSKAIVVVISSNSIGSRQVTGEVIRAHESNTKFIPILQGITHVEFQARQPEWREAIGAAASTSLPPEGVPPILPRIITGLGNLGVTPNLNPDTEKIQQIRRVLGNIREYGAPEEPGEPSALTRMPRTETVTGTITPSRTGQKTGGRKRWIIPASIVFAVAAVLFIALPAIQDMMKGDTNPTPEVTIQEPITLFPDDFEEDKPDSPRNPPTSPRDIRSDSPRNPPPSSNPRVSEIETPLALATIISVPDKNLKAAINSVLRKSPGELGRVGY